MKQATQFFTRNLMPCCETLFAPASGSAHEAHTQTSERTAAATAQVLHVLTGISPSCPRKVVAKACARVLVSKASRRSIRKGDLHLLGTHLGEFVAVFGLQIALHVRHQLPQARRQMRSPANTPQEACRCQAGCTRGRTGGRNHEWRCNASGPRIRVCLWLLQQRQEDAASLD